MNHVLIEIEFPLDLRATLQPLGGYFRPDGWWAPMRTPQGPATLHLSRRDQSVEGVAYGPGAEWALDSTCGLIGLLDDPASFVTNHGLVRDLVRQHRGLRLGRTNRVFDALLVAIVTQKVTGREAAKGIQGLRRHFSDPAPGPMLLRLPPDPEKLSHTTYFELHPLGIERRRADTIRLVAKEAGRLERLTGIAPEEARRYLERLPGVGVWTSAETVAISHGDPDAVSVGDFHLKNEVAWHLAGRPRGSDEEMMELLEVFRPHRGRVIRLLATLGHAPAFGPRLPIRNITTI